MKYITFPFVSTVAHYNQPQKNHGHPHAFQYSGSFPSATYSPESLSTHTFIGKIEAEINNPELERYGDSSFSKFMNQLINHTHIDSGIITDFTNLLYSNLLKHGIYASNIDVEYNIYRNYSINMSNEYFADNNPVGSYTQKKWKPTSYDEEIRVKYIMLTQNINDNLTTEQMVAEIEKITGKPVETNNPPPSSPSGLE